MVILENIRTLERYIESNGTDIFTTQAIKKLISHNLQKEERDLAEVMEKLKRFEEEYNMAPAEFHERFHHGELGDDEDFFTWDALFETSERIIARIKMLTGEDSSENETNYRIVHG